jgi:nitric oxide dioxygenase
MTQEQIRLVQESFAQVVPMQEKVAALFYGRLFEIDPTTLALFAQADMAEQGRRLMASLAFVVGALPQPETMLETVRGLARRHVGYGLREGQYATVGGALLWTLEQGLGAAAFTPPVRAAWTAACTLVSGAMTEAARGAPRAA